MKRRPLKLPTILWPLLFCGVLVLRARSHAGETLLIESANGQLLLIGIDGPTSPVTQSREVARLETFLSRLFQPIGRAPPPQEHRLLGFCLINGDAGTLQINNPHGGFRHETYAFRIVGIPYWSLTLFAGVLLA